MEYDLVVEGRVVLPGSVKDAQVGIRDGRISAVKRQGLRAERTIRAPDSCLVFPGFIDSHVHLREPGWEYKEDIRSGTLAAAHGGVTTVFDMPNNPTPTTSPVALDRKRRLAESKAKVEVRFFAGVTDANLAQLRLMAPSAVGFKAYLARSTGDLVLSNGGLAKAIPEVGATGKPFSLHCEDQAIIDSRASSRSSYADLRPPEAEVASVREVVGMVRKDGGVRANICHVSTAEALRLVEGSGGSGHRVHCEAALHHLFFTRKDLDGNPLLRTNPPLRGESDRVALLEGLVGGSVNSLVTDHAPHTREEKLSEGLAGVPGLDDYGHVVAWLVMRVGVDPLVVSRACSSDPASFFGLPDRGEVAVGRRGDLTVLDLKSPQRVAEGELQTKCGWSPYEGFEFPGGARWTVSGGRVVLDDGQLEV